MRYRASPSSTPTAAHSLTVAVELAGVDIFSSPATVRVTLAPDTTLESYVAPVPDASKSVASGDGLAASAIAGVLKTFQVVLLASDGVTPVSPSAAVVAANGGSDYVALILEPAIGRVQ